MLNSEVLKIEITRPKKRHNVTRIFMILLYDLMG